MHLYTQSLSPSGRRVSVFMKEKGIEVKTTEIDLRAAENLSDDYLKMNPFGRIPVLKLDSGIYLSESQAICKYFEGTNPEPNLFGQGAEEAALIEMWNRRVELNILTPVAMGFRNITGFFKDREKVVPEWGEVSVDVARDNIKLIESHLADSQYLMGERYCIADMTLAIVLEFAKTVGQDLLGSENIIRWHADVTARPAFS